MTDATVETPAGLMIFEIGEDYIVGQSYDELHVEYVQVWPLERSVGRLAWGPEQSYDIGR